jgi:hypothetical protein
MGKVLGTKVRDEYAQFIEALAEQYGCTPSNILGNFVQTIIRMNNKNIRTTPQLRHMIAKFEKQWGSEASANLGILEQNNLEIQDVIYRVSQKGRKGQKMIMFGRGMFDSREHACINSAKILECVMQTECPTVYRTLMSVPSDIEDDTIIDKLITLLNHHAEDAITNEIETMFADADRADNGRAVSQQQKYKKKYHYDPDTEYDKRQKIQEADLFSSLADAEQEAEDAG